MKKWLICLTVLFSAFLFTNKVSASNVLFESSSDGNLYGGFQSDYLQTIIDYNSIDTTVYDSVIIYKKTSISGVYHWLDFYIMIYKSSNESNFVISDSNISVNGNFNHYFKTLYSKSQAHSYLKVDLSSINYNQKLSLKTSGGAYSAGEILYKGLISDALQSEPAPNEFTINTYDTEFGGDWFGVNYIQGQQDNTVNFYIQDSGILTMNYAKGYEVEKIYYDESLTQEANLNDIVETDTNLYVTWKSKIDISKQIATDLSGNDVITITYDFSKIYNENYSYWVSNDGTNYVDITDKLNNEHKYFSGVYFAGNYYARVQDENNETISVHYINIDYYKITPTTQIGKDVDENGNIKPYVILDYSAYREIKNNIICEYSIDNGNTWIDITKELDINMKYKLYINVGDKVTSRVRTNGNTILPGETGGSNYDVTEDFYNDILINEEKDILEEFKDLLTNKNDNIFIKFKEVWEAFKDSVLFNYIYILIVGSLIILIIKSAKRN